MNIATVALLGLVALAPSDPQTCGHRANMRVIAELFGESLAYGGPLGGEEIDLTISPKGFWTLHRVVGGESCIVAEGVFLDVQFERDAFEP